MELPKLFEGIEEILWSSEIEQNYDDIFDVKIEPESSLNICTNTVNPKQLFSTPTTHSVKHRVRKSISGNEETRYKKLSQQVEKIQMTCNRYKESFKYDQSTSKERRRSLNCYAAQICRIRKKMKQTEISFENKRLIKRIEELENELYIIKHK